MEKILVTGGAGYVGSIICLALQQNGFQPIVLDSLVTGKEEFANQFINYIGEYGDTKIIKKIFNDHPNISFCIHCAALIDVPNSVRNPYEYYKANVCQSIELFSILSKLGCKNIIYSSTGSVYDSQINIEVDENSPVNPHSPLSRTKLFTELILKDYCSAYSMRGIVLRYFNPIGASPNGRFGLQNQNPTHLLGKLLEVAEGKKEFFNITGVKWETHDGTAIKDFIHVWDLALAHVKVIKNFNHALKNSQDKKKNFLVLNIGSGKGTTIQEFISLFESICGRKIKTKKFAPRPGDAIGQYTSVALAKKLINWEPKLSIEDAIRSTINWWNNRDSIINYKKR